MKNKFIILVLLSVTIAFSPTIRVNTLGGQEYSVEVPQETSQLEKKTLIRRRIAQEYHTNQCAIALANPAAEFEGDIDDCATAIIGTFPSISSYGKVYANGIGLKLEAFFKPTKRKVSICESLCNKLFGHVKPSHSYGFVSYHLHGMGLINMYFVMKGNPDQTKTSFEKIIMKVKDPMNIINASEIAIFYKFPHSIRSDSIAITNEGIHILFRQLYRSERPLMSIDDLVVLLDKNGLEYTRGAFNDLTRQYRRLDILK